MKQDQFLNVVDRDEAERRFRAALDLRPLPAEVVALDAALQRVLANDVIAPVDVPSFDRSNVDGFALRAEDTFGASEDRPKCLHLTAETLTPGVQPRVAIHAGAATTIATGAMIPRGADAVIMIEQTDADGGELLVRRSVVPGANIAGAGTDIGQGETVLRRGELLTSRETGVLAALGITTVLVVRKPRVAVISTGNELIPPGESMCPGLVYDSNATILADAVRELGGEPVMLGIVPDDRERLAALLRQALAEDVVLLSGGTSKGEGDLSYRVVAELGPPGIIAHGVALKPGKPLCLAAVAIMSHESGIRSQGSSPRMSAAIPGGPASRIVPVVILPGFPTSAIFTFHEFVAPVIRILAGRQPDPTTTVTARLPMRVNSERGRTEYLLVGLVQGVGEPAELIAYPMGKGSGSVTTFSRADGFVVIPRQQEYLEADAPVQVHLLGQGLRPADLVVIGSHCVGLDFLLGKLHEEGWRTKFLAVGSTAGLAAARRGECDLAGIHLLDEPTQVYNRPLVTTGLRLVEGYRRMQGIVYRPGDPHFHGKDLKAALTQVLADADCVMINRNRGSGTRILIDGILGGARPAGYSIEARSHNAVVAAVVQKRADWGVAIETVAQQAKLGFLPLREEHFDFVTPESRWKRDAVQSFIASLGSDQICNSLIAMGFRK
jgi:molybdopterin molybdotransferase/putative molybdopterin biosynthesis protein